MSVITDFFTRLEGETAAFIETTVNRIGPGIIDTAEAGMIILIAIYGLRMILGQTQSPLVDQLWLVFRFCMVLAFLQSFDTYSFYVVDVFQGSGSVVQSFTAAILDTDIAETNSQLDDFYDRGLEASATIWSEAGTFEFDEYILGFIVWIATIIATGIALIVLSIAIIGANLILAFGPVAILCFLFQPARGIFEGSLRLLITFVLTQILLMMALSLLLGIFEGFLSEMESNLADETTRFTTVGVFGLVSLITLIVTAQIPNFASGIGGGISVGTMGYAQNVMRSAERAAGAGATKLRQGFIWKEPYLGGGSGKDGLRGADTQGWRQGWITRRVVSGARTLHGLTRPGSGGGRPPGGARGPAGGPGGGAPSGGGGIAAGAADRVARLDAQTRQNTARSRGTGNTAQAPANDAPPRHEPGERRSG